MNPQQLLNGPSVGRNISLPKNLDRALKDQAHREDRSVSRIVRRAIVNYLEDQAVEEDDHQSEPA